MKSGDAIWPQRALVHRTVRLLFALVLLNSPFWLLASQIFIARSLLSLDSLLALVVLQFSPGIGAVLIAVSWASDMLVNTSRTYHFASILEFMRSIAFAATVDWSNFVQAKVVALAIPFMAAAIALKWLELRKIGAFPIALTILALLAVDTVNGSSALAARDVRLAPLNVAGSSLHAIARAVLNDDKESEMHAVQVPGGWTEFNSYLPSARSDVSGVLYVMVESLGVHSHPAVRTWLRDQLFPVELRATYDLHEATLFAHGGTTSSELRRLCGLQGSYRRFDLKAGHSCLPQLFANDGWSTLGLHGFSERMFERHRWWPLLGLKDVRFAEQLVAVHARECGAAFRGVCDEDLLSTAVAAASKPRSFVYALTLNTHLPLAPAKFPPDLAVTCLAASVGDDVCTLLAYLGVTLRAVAQELGAQKVAPSVMLVGDHPPPFAETRSRQQFLHKTVPVYALAPRRIAAAP